MSELSITLSPVYPAAATLLGSERGLSIRFPRFIKIREDKTFEQATSSDQFADMYRRQIQEAPARKPVGGVNSVNIVKQGSEERDGDGGEHEDDEQGDQLEDEIQDDEAMEDE
jgi:DNA ligase-1